jgi:serine-type D-Ala-D-Ala carboxypeptidase/endopeptidase (penicillin-binding protein 4)
LWAWSDRQVSSVQRVSAPVASAPLFSARRAPTELSSQLTANNLSTVLGPLVSAVSSESRQASCLAVSVDGQRVVDVGAGRTVIPASNLKLLTTAVALEVLGPDYQFTTTAAGNLVGDTVEGDLFLVGGGDPLLATNGYESAFVDKQLPATQLADLAAALFDAGVRRITGNVVADESRYDNERFGIGWTDEVTGAGPGLPEAGPLSALMLNDSVEVIGGAKRDVENSAQNTVEQFTAILRFSGIEIGGSPIVGGPATGTATIATLQSGALRDIVAEALQLSDDNTAELLLKEIGFARRSAGNALAGGQVVIEQLAAWGIPTEGLTIVDGSGLSSQNRVTCGAVMGVLEHLGATGPVFDGLPVAGRSGTLGPNYSRPGEPDNPDQFAGTSVDGVLRAKTGTLGQSGSKGLSGYLPIEGGSPIVFSLIGNVDAGNQDTTEAIIYPWWRLLAETFSKYEPGPTADELAPR